MNLDQYRDPEGGYRYQDTWYQDAHSLVLTGMLGFCGCGMPEEATRYVKDVMEYIDAGMSRGPDWDYGQWEAQGRELASKGALYFTYYVLDEKELTEHGGAVPGWLTEKGKMLLNILRELPKESA